MIGICNTDGRGYWSTVIKPVAITRLELDQIEEDQFGELRAYFDETSKRSLLERRAQESDFRKQEITNVPMTIYIG